MRKDIYKSKAWKDISKAYALSKHCQCEKCGRFVYVAKVSQWLPKEKRLGYVVHHKTYLTDENYTDDSIAYDWNNLELLCSDCHNAIHHGSPVTKGDVMFDELGNLIKIKKIF